MHECDDARDAEKRVGERRCADGGIAGNANARDRDFSHGSSLLFFKRRAYAARKRNLGSPTQNVNASADERWKPGPSAANGATVGAVNSGARPCARRTGPARPRPT